uniref:Isoform 2 of Galanin-like peptide n=1 Tax=Mus musculus TaxID=10090 RepID=Q810H5-2
MACSVHLVLFLTILLSLAETPESAPAHRSSPFPPRPTRAGRETQLLR